MTPRQGEEERAAAANFVAMKSALRVWPLLALFLIGCSTSSESDMDPSSSAPNDPWAPGPLSARTAEFDAIPADRKAELEAIGD